MDTECGGRALDLPQLSRGNGQVPYTLKPRVIKHTKRKHGVYKALGDSVLGVLELLGQS